MKWKFTIGAEVVENPIGWADASFMFKRDKELHGVFFEYTASLRFYGDGFAIIQEEYLQQGVQGSLTLLIEYQCSPTDDYEEFFTGLVSFDKIVFDESDLCTVEVPIGDESCLNYFKNRQDQEVDLDSLESFDGTELSAYDGLGKVIPLAPKTILKTDDFHYVDTEIIDGEQVTATDDSTVVGPQTFTEYIWLSQPDIIDEIIGVADDYEAGFSNIITDVPSYWIAPYLPGSSGWQLEIEMQFRLEVDVLLTNGEVNGCGVGDKFEDVVVELVLRRLRGVTLSYESLGTQTFSGCHDNLFDEEVTFSYSGAFPGAMSDVQSSDEFALYIQVETSGDFQKLNPGDPIAIDLQNVITQHGTSFFKVTVETVYPTTNAKINMVNEALSRTVESITNDCLRVRSDYFGRVSETPSSPYAPEGGNGCGSMECITTGLLLRRKEDATQKISFKTLYDGLNAIHNLGMSIEPDPDRDGFEQVRIEQSSYFYSDEVVMQCTNVPVMRRTAITDELYSIIEIGYQKWEAEAFNGLDEFNTQRKYRTSLKQVKNTLSKVSSLIASGYAIELTRQQYSNTSKDWRYDNDHFIICVAEDGDSFVVEQGNILAPANLIDPDSVYNFRISPVRNLLRWMNKIMAPYLEVSVEGTLYYLSGTGNTEAEGFLNDSCAMEIGEAISEQEPEITVANVLDEIAATPIYKPELWEFDYPLSVQEYLAIRANPKGIVQVQWGQNLDTHDTYIRNIQYKPNDGIATFSVLPVYPGIVSDFILQEDGDYLLQEDLGRLRQD